MSVFKWIDSKEWSGTIRSLMQDYIDNQVIEYLRHNHSKCIVSDDSAWLDTAIAACGHTLKRSSFETFSNLCLDHYTMIRAFHGCRPANIDSYYREGLRPLISREADKQALDLFRSDSLPEITEEKIWDAIRRVGTETREGNTHLILDDRFLIKYAGHYLIHGSEYLMSIAGELKRSVGKDLTMILRNIGIPTIFICDIPISRFDYNTLRDLAGTLLSHYFESLLSGTSNKPLLDFTITLQDILEPNYIISHYHPPKIPNPHNSWKIYSWKNEIRE